MTETTTTETATGWFVRFNSDESVWEYGMGGDVLGSDYALSDAVENMRATAEYDGYCPDCAAEGIAQSLSTLGYDNGYCIECDWQSV